MGLISSRASIRVQPFFGFRNDTHLTISARALRRPEPVFDKRGFWRSLSTMIGQYASREVAGLEVRLEFASPSGAVIRKTGVTNREGFVRFDVPFEQPIKLPQNTGWEEAVLAWHPGKSAPERRKTAHVLAPGNRAGLAVISDIDDTILETGITGSLRAIARNWKRVMAQMPGERIVAPGAPAFFAALGGGTGRKVSERGPFNAPVPQPIPRPVFYVSSSPWNLFSYLITFKHQRDLPLGPIMLRDWGLNRQTLGKEGHGSHKHLSIKRILETYPHMKFVLVGDDTQKDLTVFGTLAATRPDRIAAVFIRRISGRAFDDNELTIKAGAEESGVPFWMGSDYGDARLFLDDIGLSLRSEATTKEHEQG